MKKISLILGVCTAFFYVAHAHAAINEKQNLNYAQPCEAVQPQSMMLKKLQSEIQKNPEDREKILAQFWKNIEKKQTPLIENITADSSRITYLWRGAQHNVRLVGGPSNDHEWLTRLPNTDVWFKESMTNNHFMGSYRFAVDIKNVDGFLSNYCPHLNADLKESRQQRVALRDTFQLDPFNPQTVFSELNTENRNENMLALSNAPVFIDPKQYKDRVIEVKSQTLHSKTLNNQREIKIYKSKKLYEKQSYITAIFFDGDYYANLLQVPKALDILVEQGKLPPIQAVFIDPVNAEVRPKELTPNTQFSTFFQKEFLSWLDVQIQRDPNKTVLLGSSLGGLSAAYLALENPDQISHVVPLSGSFWWKKSESDVPNGMSNLIRTDTRDISQQWFISANSYETSQTNNGLSILNTSPMVAEDLTAKGHQVVFKQYVGGHSYALWQVILQDALQYFFTVKTFEQD